jgi:DNA-binding NtrC family response regulator
MRKVLIVEDDPQIRSLLEDFLDGKAETESAATAEEAQDQIRKKSFDYFLLDGLEGEWKGLAYYIEQQAPHSEIAVFSANLSIVSEARHRGYNAAYKGDGFAAALKQLGLL